MYSRRSGPIFTSSFSDDEASDDEPSVVIEKIEQVYQNGEKFVETEQNYEIPNRQSNVNNEIDESINSLCRICSSKGLVSINSSLTAKLMVLTPMQTDKLAWQQPISRLIAEVSGEEVSEDDGLPQFVCTHCLGYLQHAFSLRLKIRSNSANLRLAKELACERSVCYDQQTSKSVSENEPEIDESHEELFEDAKFLETFRGADISIAFMTDGPTPTKRSLKVTEHKCETCKKRMMTRESLARHQKVCEMTIIGRFDAQFRHLIGLTYVQQITTNEFVLRTIKLIFDTQKDLARVVNKQGTNVNSISMVTMDEVAKSRPYQSPDFGYSSDGVAASSRQNNVNGGYV